jgi:hypothetical protein
MPYRNDYAGLPVIEEKLWHAETPAEEYDLSFAYEVPQRDLMTGSVTLRPLIVRFSSAFSSFSCIDFPSSRVPHVLLLLSPPFLYLLLTLSPSIAIPPRRPPPPALERLSLCRIRFPPLRSLQNLPHLPLMA